MKLLRCHMKEMYADDDDDYGDDVDPDPDDEF